MMDQYTEMFKGILEGCVMEIINREQTYGYEITRQLRALGFTEISEGTVYTILIRLDRDGLVDTVKLPSEKGPSRRVFSLNADGQKELKSFWIKWDFLSKKIQELKESSTCANGEEACSL